MLTFRKATLNDLPLLKYWDEQPHVIASDPNDDWEWENDLSEPKDWLWQYIAEVEGQPIGFLQIIDPARETTHYWGKDVNPNWRAIDIWIGEKDYLNKGYGTKMMQKALEMCFKQTDVTAVVVDPLVSNTGAHRFYERLGFQNMGQRTFGKDDCYVYHISREDWRRH